VPHSKPLRQRLMISSIFGSSTRGDHPITTTDEEIDAAIERGRSETRHAVVAANYISDREQIALEFDDGIEVRLPRRLIEGLENANAEQLSHIVIEGPGMGLAWPDLGENVAHYVPNLMDGIFGTRRHMQEIARAGGRAKSPAKTAAVRENGKKGGRPRKSIA
jgi:hypothetical protein